MKKKGSGRLIMLSVLLAFELLVSGLAAGAFADDISELSLSVELLQQSETEPVDIGPPVLEILEEEQQELQEEAEETKPFADPEADSEAEEVEPEITEVERQVTEEEPAEAPEKEPAAQCSDETEEAAEETPFQPEGNTDDLPEEQTEPEQPVEEDDGSEELTPTWSIQLPDNPPVAYGAEIMNISAAVAVDIKNLGDSTIYLTVTSNCIFTGNMDGMPIMLCVDGVPVTPGEPIIYGAVTSAGSYYMPVTLLFSEEGWRALSSGSYSMSIQYDSFVA